MTGLLNKRGLLNEGSSAARHQEAYAYTKRVFFSFLCRARQHRNTAMERWNSLPHFPGHTSLLPELII